MHAGGQAAFSKKLGKANSITIKSRKAGRISIAGNWKMYRESSVTENQGLYRCSRSRRAMRSRSSSSRSQPFPQTPLMICIDTFISSMTEDRGVVSLPTGWVDGTESPATHPCQNSRRIKKRKKPIGSEELCEVLGSFWALARRTRIKPDLDKIASEIGERSQIRTKMPVK